MQSIITSNNDGTYLLTFSSSLAANFLITLKLAEREVGNASVAVAPREPDAAHSSVFSPDFGILDPGNVLTLTAGRSYEFGVLLYDVFGNTAAEDGSLWILEATLRNRDGSADFVTDLNQRTKRYTDVESPVLALSNL